ncbi:hypothetical protein KP79_PYT06960 [Mizuhopecten yessoensis]|uniref:Uncharacterized protein n=1 Tax=Mizuhopecten yessoensis TaxID=6573 RepID=A0A210QJS1_MIZYE|nr:hypothetical protein KP79_PYT06960 [Mizuhopecten yessoensis]
MKVLKKRFVVRDGRCVTMKSSQDDLLSLTTVIQAFPGHDPTAVGYTTSRNNNTGHLLIPGHRISEGYRHAAQDFEYKAEKISEMAAKRCQQIPRFVQRLGPNDRTRQICHSTDDEWYHDPVSRTWSWLG